MEKGILNIIENSPDEIKKRKCTQSYGNWLYNEENEILGLAEAITTNNDTILSNFQILLKELMKFEKNIVKLMLNAKILLIYLFQIIHLELKALYTEIKLPIF